MDCQLQARPRLIRGCVYRSHKPLFCFESRPDALRILPGRVRYATVYISVKYETALSRFETPRSIERGHLVSAQGKAKALGISPRALSVAMWWIALVHAVHAAVVMAAGRGFLLLRNLGDHRL